MIIVDIETYHEQASEYVDGRILIKTGDPHPKIKGAFYYTYECLLDGDPYNGELVHSPKKGVVSLVAKVTKAIRSQQKAA